MSATPWTVGLVAISIRQSFIIIIYYYYLLSCLSQAGWVTSELVGPVCVYMMTLQTLQHRLIRLCHLLGFEGCDYKVHFTDLSVFSEPASVPVFACKGALTPFIPPETLAEIHRESWIPSLGVSPLGTRMFLMAPVHNTNFPILVELMGGEKAKR